MKISFRSRLFVGFTLAIALSAVSGTTSFVIFRKQAAQRLWVKHTHHIIDSSKTALSLMIDMEVGSRGYRATGQLKFLDPYNAALPHIEPLLEGIKDSLEDNPADQQLAAELQTHARTLLQFWATKNEQTNNTEAGINISSTHAGQYTHEEITALTAEEKNQMDKVRSIVTTLEKNENKLLLARREEYDALIHDATVSATTGSILSEIIIVALTILVFREFKRRRLVQEQLNKTVAKLEMQTEELRASEEIQKKSVTEIEAINKQLEKFVYTVAHDIKSPLAGISGSLSILEMDTTVAANPELADFVRMSKERVQHLSGMVNSILEYSRLSVKNQQTEEVDTRKLVEGIITIMFPPQNIKINIVGAMPVIHTQRIKIMEVFQNLISNAIKYNNKKEGTIEIGCKDQHTYYEFYVKDNGIGIREENKDEIFSLFRDAQHEPMRESSTGFGLNIVKLIMDEQGGKIWVDSIPGEGSTFYFQWKK